jgi:hypothetical protein
MEKMADHAVRTYFLTVFDKYTGYYNLF